MNMIIATLIIVESLAEFTDVSRGIPIPIASNPSKFLISDILKMQYKLSSEASPEQEICFGAILP